MNIWDVNGHRAIFGETWVSTDDETSPLGTYNDLGNAATRWFRPWGSSDLTKIYVGAQFCERLWPLPRWRNGLVTSPQATHTHLNVAAPEAAFRMQRVGASGSLGRLNVPVLLDSWFTDLPHRRHIDWTTFNPLRPVPGIFWPQVVLGSSSRTYRNVLFDRVNATWQDVVSYQLRPSTARIWNRWRTAPIYPGGDPRNSYVPEEFDPTM